MMMAFLLAAAPAADPPRSIDGLPLGGLARQALPAKGCAAYLFTTGQTKVLAAMAGAQALRLALDGTAADYPRVGPAGAESLGLPAQGVYRAGAVTATLDMTVERRDDLTAGAMIPVATLRIDREGHDTVVVPLAGMVGCRA